MEGCFDSKQYKKSRHQTEKIAEYVRQTTRNPVGMKGCKGGSCELWCKRVEKNKLKGCLAVDDYTIVIRVRRSQTLAKDLGEVTGMTPDLSPTSPNYHTTPTGRH
ncbi:hypothetical protein TNCV_3653171 [Trichonephila clavipes]|nr:hypothetical protein TNCV_3653171 [Trichonephila clavipes]